MLQGGGRGRALGHDVPHVPPQPSHHPRPVCPVLARDLPEEGEVIEWRDIPGHPGYRISSTGLVESRRRKAPVVLKPYTNRKGYELVRLYPCGRNQRVHRLALLAFIGPCPPGLEGCHKDGNPRNNRIENLRWGTAKSNAEDRVAHGRQARGALHPGARLTAADVAQARAWVASGMTRTEAATRLGVSRSTVSLICSGKRWAHVP